MKYCHNCGARLIKEDNFCKQCGEDIRFSVASEIKDKNEINIFQLVVKTVIIVLIGFFIYSWLLDYINFLETVLLVSGLGLTLSVFLGKENLFPLAFGWGIFMLTMLIIGFLSDLDFGGRIVDMTLWVIDLLVLYKYQNQKE